MAASRIWPGSRVLGGARSPVCGRARRLVWGGSHVPDGYRESYQRFEAICALLQHDGHAALKGGGPSYRVLEFLPALDDAHKRPRLDAGGLGLDTKASAPKRSPCHHDADDACQDGDKHLRVRCIWFLRSLLEDKIGSVLSARAYEPSPAPEHRTVSRCQNEAHAHFALNLVTACLPSHHGRGSWGVAGLDSSRRLGTDPLN